VRGAEAGKVLGTRVLATRPREGFFYRAVRKGGGWVRQQSGYRSTDEKGRSKGSKTTVDPKEGAGGGKTAKRGGKGSVKGKRATRMYLSGAKREKSRMECQGRIKAHQDRKPVATAKGNGGEVYSQAYTLRVQSKLNLLSYWKEKGRLVKNRHEERGGEIRQGEGIQLSQARTIEKGQKFF